MNKRQLNASGYKQNQQGFTLVMALGFMVFLTLIVLSMVNITSSDEKIARNARDKDIAFAAAEAALRDAEMYVSGSYMLPYNAPKPYQFTDQCTNALCDFGISPINLEQLDFFDSDDALASNSMPIGTVTQSPQIAKLAADDQPRYMIEVVSRNDPNGQHKYQFRITVQSRGMSPDTRVSLQELYFPTNLEAEKN